MKIYLVLLFLVNLISTFGQKPIASIEMPEYNVLYRGYSNKIIVGVTHNNKANVQISGQGCSIIKDNEDGHFIVKPITTEGVVSISVILVEGKKTDTLETKLYRVMNLPVPSVYFGSNISGSKANIHERKVFVKYPPEIPLNTTFIVKSWEIQVNDQVVSGKGNTLINVDSLFQSVTSPTTLTIELIFVGNDDIKRKLKGQWEIPAWSPEGKVPIIESGE